MEQVWFSGVHSDVGGGYKERGLGDIAFLWMVEKAESCGLSFDRDFIESETNPDPLGRLHKTMNIGWWLAGLGPLVREIGVTNDATEAAHATAIERFRSEMDYKPTNLGSYLSRPGYRVAGADTDTEEEAEEAPA